MLVTPDLIEQACLDVLRGKLVEHIAQFERDRQLEPKTIEQMKTVDLLVGSGARLREDQPPACLLGVFGFAKEPTYEGRDNTLTIDWNLTLLVAVLGVDRADTIKRRHWYSMLVAECLLSRLPRDNDLIDSVEWSDLDLDNGTTKETNPRAVGEAQLVFTVRTRKALDVRILPPANTTVPPGTPFGPPAAPYEPPAPDPTMAPGYPKSEADLEGP